MSAAPTCLKIFTNQGRDLYADHSDAGAQEHPVFGIDMSLSSSCLYIIPHLRREKSSMRKSHLRKLFLPSEKRTEKELAPRPRVRVALSLSLAVEDLIVFAC